MNIWVPKFKIVEPKSEITATFGIHGRFKLRAVRPDGAVRAETPWFSNMILDAGLNRLGTTSSAITLCAVGTGTLEPTRAQTQLQTFVASTFTTQSEANNTITVSPYGARKVLTYRFALGAVVGNMTEVGVGWADTTLFSRELIRDSEGVPTAFTVLADEQLDATYEITAYPPLVDVVADIEITGSGTHTTTMRARNVHSSTNGWTHLANKGVVNLAMVVNVNATGVFSGGLGTITSNPTGTQSNGTSMSSAAYGDGSYFRDYTIQWGLNNGNFAGGIPCASWTATQGHSWQVGFDPVILKNNEKILTLNFRHSIAHFEP